MYQLKKDKGATLIIFTFVIMVVLIGVLVAYSDMVSSEIRSAGAGLRNIQAFWLAEAGLAKARWALTTDEQTVPWDELDFELGNGTFTVSATDEGGGTVTTITSDGYIPDDTNPVAQRRVVEADISISAGGGTNLSLGAAASASSESGVHPASDANDGSGSSKWQASDKGDAWLKLDFGSSATFDSVVVNGQKNINSVTIEYSTNGVTYQEVTNPQESPDWTYTFDSVEARYLKLNMAVNSNKKAEINEFESYNTAAGSTTLGQGEFSTVW